ncbi:hypothetical protein EDD37DRAFT_60203 [Exophiala viscosa]|uniref:uncharacterized protein n=1 Tax=Exophiala viscosa TaxID=2486360 RepID=UPI00218F38E3|nr:hypothetical protein EDD37DRAFT_60203 [Exophiala viscosa]
MPASDGPGKLAVSFDRQRRRKSKLSADHVNQLEQPIASLNHDDRRRSTFFLSTVVSRSPLLASTGSHHRPAGSAPVPDYPWGGTSSVQSPLPLLLCPLHAVRPNGHFPFFRPLLLCCFVSEMPEPAFELFGFLFAFVHTLCFSLIVQCRYPLRRCIEIELMCRSTMTVSSFPTHSLETSIASLRQPTPLVACTILEIVPTSGLLAAAVGLCHAASTHHDITLLQVPFLDRAGHDGHPRLFPP